MAAGIEIVMTGKDIDVLRMFKRQNAEILRNQRALLKTGQAGAHAGKTVSRSFTSVAKSAIASRYAIFTVGSALVGLLVNQRKLREEAEKTAIAHDKSARRLRIQSGMSAIQSEESQKKAGEIAVRTGIKKPIINRAATEFVSTGFIGDSMDLARTFFDFGQSANVKDYEENIETLVAAFSKQLVAGGKALTEKNLKSLAVRLRGAFAGTPIQAADLVDFSKVKGIATEQGISDENFLSGASIIKRQMSAAEGATGLGNLITRLAVANSEPKIKKAIEGAGIDPTTVDLIGETLPEVLATLNEAIDKMPEEKRVPFLATVFSRRKSNLAAVQSLLKGQREGLFEKYGKAQRDTLGFELGARVARGGPAVGVERAETELAESQERLVKTTGVTDTSLKAVIKSGDIQELAAIDEEYKGSIQRKPLLFMEAGADLTKEVMMKLFGPRFVASKREYEHARELGTEARTTLPAQLNLQNLRALTMTARDSSGQMTDVVDLKALVVAMGEDPYQRFAAPDVSRRLRDTAARIESGELGDFQVRGKHAGTMGESQFGLLRTLADFVDQRALPASGGLKGGGAVAEPSAGSIDLMIGTDGATATPAAGAPWKSIYEWLQIEGPSVPAGELGPIPNLLQLPVPPAAAGRNGTSTAQASQQVDLLQQIAVGIQQIAAGQQKQADEPQQVEVVNRDIPAPVQRTVPSAALSR